MKQRIFAIALLLVLALALTLPAFARSGVSGQPLLCDEAQLLTADETAALNERLELLSNRYEMDIVLLTTLSLDGKNEMDYADDFYDENGYAADGVLLLFFTGEERGLWMSTSGECMDIFSVDGMHDIFEEIIPTLSVGNYAAAFDLYLNQVENYILGFDTDPDYDPDHPDDSFDPDGSDAPAGTNYFSLFRLIVSIAGGALLALIPLGVMRSKLRSVRPKYSAENYVREGSFRLTRDRDLFLYHTVTRTARPKDNDGGSGSGAHTSSSGASHGGAGTRF